MADLSTMLAWREALRRARFAGTLSVEVDGRKVQYKNDAEMRQADSDLSNLIAEASGNEPVTTIRFSTSKGF